MPKLGTRDTILQVGTSLAEYGIELLTVRAVAKRMGMTIGGVYYHFNGDEALRAAVLEHAARNPFILGQLRARRRSV